jgi:FAD:protein FMN transferase
MPNYTIQFRAMGCRVQAWLHVSDRAEAAILHDVPRWFAQWEATLSRFRPESELSRLNACAGSWVQVSPLLLWVVQAARTASERTDGLVNPLILNALESAGYDRPFEMLTENNCAVPIQPIPDASQIGIDSEKGRIRLPPGARLDLGGIAKGWAAEQAVIALSKAGAAMVDAGGDIAARGAPDDSGGWRVQIPVPGRSAPYRVLLSDSAIATSGTGYRRWQQAGIWQHHIIDPRTGQPAQSGIVQASVIAPEMLHAESWAKAVVIGGIAPPYPSLLVHETGAIQSNFEEGTYHVQA